MQPIIDVIVPVHTETRPVARAVASIVGHTEAPVRVTVVAHNIEPDRIARRLGPYAEHPSVRLIELQDGIRSPAGPYNLGLAEATAPTVAVLGSDDELQPGALDSWLAVLRSTGAAMVIGRILYADGRQEPSPPVRWRRWNRLHPVGDRLSYRSAPLGLIDRAAFGELRFSEGLGSGEDLVFVARIWFSRNRIAYDRRGPAYFGHEDEGDRTTGVVRTVAEDFAYLDELLAVVDEYGGNRARRSVAAKLIRVHVFDAVAARVSRGPWLPGQREEIVAVARRILAWGPGAEKYLSRVDRIALDTLLDPQGSTEVLLDAFQRRWDQRSLDALLPRNPLRALHAQSPLRIFLHL